MIKHTAPIEDLPKENNSSSTPRVKSTNYGIFQTFLSRQLIGYDTILNSKQTINVFQLKIHKSLPRAAHLIGRVQFSNCQKCIRQLDKVQRLNVADLGTP